MDTNTPLSPSENDSLNSLMPFLTVPNQAAPAPAARPDLLTRVGQQAANLPSNMVSGVGNMVGNILQMGVPSDARVTVDVPKPFNIDAPQTLGEKLVDTGAGIVSQLPAYLLPELAVGKVAGAAGIADSMLARAAGAATSGVVNNPDDPITNGALMGVTGGLSTLSRGARLLPQLAVGGAAAANTLANGGSGTDAAIQGGLFGIMGMIPGNHGDGTVVTDSSTTAPTRVQERGIVPYNPGTGFTMGAGSDIPATAAVYPRATTFGGDLPAGNTALLADRVGAAPEGTPQLLNRDNPTGFQLGDVTSQSQPNFILGRDTTTPINGGLTDTPVPFQLMAPNEEIPSGAKQLLPPPSTVPTFPDGHSGQLTLQADPRIPQVISSAINPGDGRTLVGKNWNEGHAGIGIRHIDSYEHMDEPPQDQRGFLVHDPDGTQRFASREEALPYAKAAGQVPSDFNQTLNSQDLKVAGTYDNSPVPEKGSGDSPAPIVTSQPDPLVAPAKSAMDVTPPPSEPAEPAEPAQPVAAAPKAVAAISGQPDLLNGDISHFDADTQTDIQEYRDMHNQSVAGGYTDDAEYALKRLADLHGIGENSYVPPGGPVDVPKPLVTSQKVGRSMRGASWLYDDSVKSSDVSYKGDESDESLIPFSEDPSGSDKQILTNALDANADVDDLAKLKAVFGEGGSDAGAQGALKDFLLKNHVPDVSDDYVPTEDDLKEAGVTADHDEAAADDLDSKADVKGSGENVEQSKMFGALLKAIEKGDVSDADLGLKRNARKARTSIRKVLAPNTAIDGFVSRQLLGYMGRFAAGAAVGGPVGANLDDENRKRGFILGALTLGLGAAHLPQLIKMLSKDFPKTIKEQVDAVKSVTSQPGAKVGDLMQNFAADDFTAGSDLFARKALRNLSLSFTRSEDVREIIQASNTQHLQDMADDAMRGMFESGEKETLSPAELAAYEKYRTSLGTLDPATGDIIDDPMRTTRFMMDLAAHPQFAGGAVVERQVRMLQQQAIHKSAALGALKNKIADTIGKYSTDSYRIFGSGWKPSEVEISKAVDSLDWLGAMPTYNRGMISKYVGRYLEGIYQNRNLYEGGSGNEGATLDMILQRKGSGLSPELTKEIMDQQPTAKSVDEIVSSQLYLKPETKAKLWNQITSGNYIQPQWRDLMGMYTDPAEKSVATMMKLMPAVRAAKLFEAVASGKNDLGLPFSLSATDHALQESTIKAQLSTATDPKIIQGLQRKLIDLNNRVLLPKTANLGILSDTLVSPDIANVLPDMAKGLVGKSSLPVTRAILEGTKAIKLGQTLLNPISYVRWAWNAPLLGGLAGNTPMDIGRGFNVVRGKGALAAVKTRLVNLGVMSADIATNDFNTTAKRALSGNLDQNILDRFLGTPFMRKAADVYGMSDNSIRAATFLRREQENLSKSAPDVAAGRVTSQDAAKAAEKDAIRYTNRYTVDYGNVPGGLAYVRKMPFVSMYLTYAYETSRILKNIIVDATGKGPYGKEAQFGAAAKLATIATVPAAITAGATAMMSDQDQKDWKKTVGLMQPYARPRWLVPLGKRADGSFRYVDLTSMDPVGDWSTFGRAMASGDFRQVVASNPYIGTDNTPALNVATEIITGQNTRTGRQINTVGRALDAARQELAPSFAGGYEFDNLMRAIQTNDQGEWGVQRLGSGKGYSLNDLLITYATGIRPTSINTDWSMKTAVGEAQGQLQTEHQFLMDTMQSNMTQEAKDAAKKRFMDAATNIIAHLKLRLDGGGQ